MAWELVEDGEPSSKQDPARELRRQLGRPLEKVTTRVAGLPGDIASLLNIPAGKISESLTGEKSLPYEQTYLGKILPTTQKLRAGIESQAPEFFQPQNKVEQFVDNVLEDTALLFVPGGKVTKALKPVTKTQQVLKNTAKAIGANLAGETVEQVTGSKKAGAYTKAGMLFFTSLMDTPKAAEEISKLYNNARGFLPQNAIQSSKKLNTQLSNLKNDITKGRPISNLSKEEKWVIDQIEKVETLGTSGNYDINQLWAQKTSLNKELGQSLSEFFGKGTKKGIKNRAKQINGFIRDTIEDYGQKNPEFYKNFKEADDAFGTLAKSNFVSNWINENVKHGLMTEGLLTIFGVPSAALGTALGYIPGKLIYQISKSPTLSKIYGNAVKAAAKEDVAAFNKYLKELDDKLQKEESEERWEFVD